MLSPPDRNPDPARHLDALLARRVILVTGKGGVGKSTLSALLARRAQAQGHRVLICSMDAHDALGPALGADRALTHRPTTLEPGLDAARLDPDQAVVDALVRFLPTPRLARRLVDHRPLRMFLRTAPAATGFSMMQTMMDLALADKGRRFDRVVVDLPATGHARTFLEAPRALSDIIGRGKVAESALQLHHTLVDPRQTALLLTTLPEEMPVNETLQLAQHLTLRMGLRPAAVCVNQVRPSPVAPRDEPVLAQALTRVLASGQPPDPPMQMLADGLMMGLQQSAGDRAQALRLAQGLSTTPLIALPRLVASKEADLVAALARWLTHRVPAITLVAPRPAEPQPRPEALQGVPG